MYFIIHVLHGAKVSAKIVQYTPPKGDTSAYTEKSQLYMYIKKYQALIWEKYTYKEPVDGKFEDATAAIFDGLQLSEAKENSDDSELELEL